jgi:hypothetical protein
MKNQSFAEKLALAAVSAGSAATILSAPTTTNAELVQVKDRPITLTATLSPEDWLGQQLPVGWDVDGDGNDDAAFIVRYFGFAVEKVDNWLPNRAAFFDYRHRDPPLSIEMNVYAASSIIAAPGYIGSTTGSFARIAYGFDSSASEFFVNGFGFAGELGLGQNFVGFVFEDQLGYADLRFQKYVDGNTVLGLSMTVAAWAYETEVGKAIHVEPIPAPPAAVGALTLLGLGAAGVRSWRRARAA